MKGFREIFKSTKRDGPSSGSNPKKEKGKRKDKKKGAQMDDERPPAYFHVSPEWGAPSAPLFGYDESYEEPSSVIATKVQYKFSLDVAVNYPFANFIEALHGLKHWCDDYRGLFDKRGIYNILMLYAARRLKAGPKSIYNGRSIEYHSTGSGKFTLHHTLKNLFNMDFTSEQFVRSWTDPLRSGTLNFFVWVGETDTQDELPPMIGPAEFSDATEFNTGCEVLGIKIEVQSDNTWVVVEA
ncbi:matrix protein [Vesiculovirus bogdanovac]|uniref:Matrix protein n=1 Tax=Vesiculovirus bogdanovac TaxID=1972567 RepID=K4FCJ4_9RHAB|nr:matrix protein [Vesiculovirus bogdanovac]AFH89678.1 matrix protein [Vesiculovirus bogdanovac]